MYLNCLCANLAYGLPELNKTNLLLWSVIGWDRRSHFNTYKNC